MKTTELQEIWQVEVNGQVYEAAFGELPDWIAEGSLLPDDMVRKGNLRWIKAGRVPHLIQFFNAKAQGIAAPVIVQTAGSEESPASPAESLVPQIPPTTGTNSNPLPHRLPVEQQAANVQNFQPIATQQAVPGFCCRHTDVVAVYLCDGCEKEFCKACPNSYGGSVRICPECGQMCRSTTEIQAKKAANAAGSAIMYESFGFSDLARALAHPFNFKASLIFGAIVFIFLAFGQSAIGLPGIIFPVVGLICMILSNGLTFSILANTVGKFAHGKVDADFMPDFENFSVWDDFIHPSLLGISAYIISFGPFMAAFAIAGYMVFSSVSSQMDTYQTKLESLPGTPIYNSREVVDQTAEVKKLLTEAAEKNDAKIVLQDQTATNQPKLDSETEAQNRIWAEIQADRQKQFEALAGDNQMSQQQMMLMIQNVINVAAPVMVVGFILFIWGMIFFPAVCAVAGYTRSIAATLNPLVALSTMFNLGGNYVKLIFMTVLLSICCGIIMMIIAVVTAPLMLIGVGNLPSKAGAAVVGFYFWVAFSCLLGYMIFKSADKLDIKR